MTNTNTANFSLGALLSREKYLIIDGSMSTALEQLGCNLNDRLWTARVLADHPELVKEVHLQYLRAKQGQNGGRRKAGQPADTGLWSAAPLVPTEPIWQTVPNTEAIMASAMRLCMNSIAAVWNCWQKKDRTSS